MAKVSVIVPVYNTAGVVRECLGNLAGQTLSDIELVLVNDASTDGSMAILEECERAYPDKVMVIHCAENGGAGGARNIGLSYASGTYIGFVDSDDLADASMFEKLYRRAAETGADIVDSGYYMKEHDRAILHTSDEMTGVLDDRKRSELIVSGGYICTKLFRREVLAGVSFRERCILEDADFLTYLYATAGRVETVKEILYYYRDSETGQTHKTQDPLRYNQNLTAAMQAVYDKVAALPGYEGIRAAVEYEMIDMYNRAVLNTLADRKGARKLDTLRMLGELAALKKRLVRGGYDNPYVQAKLEPIEIEALKRNDRNPRSVLEML